MIFSYNLGRDVSPHSIMPVVIAGIFLLCQACGYKTGRTLPEDPYFTGTDSYGREIVLEEKPEKIISLSPGITEMVFLLGCGGQLVGVSDFCTYPPEVEKIRKVGGMQNFSVENLASLSPDVVLIGSIVRKEDVEKIEGMGIPVIALKEESRIEGLCHALEILGLLLGKEEKAQEEIQAMEEKLSRIGRLPEDSTQRPSLYYVAGFGAAGDFTAPSPSHIHEILTLAGGRNIGEKLTSWNVSREYIFQENPDYIIIRKEDAELFSTTYPYNLLPAVRQGRVIPMESGWIDIVSPRNIQAIEHIYTHTHP